MFTADLFIAILSGRQLEDTHVCHDQSSRGALERNIDKLEICDKGETCNTQSPGYMLILYRFIIPTLVLRRNQRRCAANSLIVSSVNFGAGVLEYIVLWGLRSLLQSELFSAVMALCILSHDGVNLVINSG